MQVQIESTADIAIIDGVHCRRWKGVTAEGTECEVFVHRIAVHKDNDSSQFQRELFEQLPPPNTPVDLRFLLP